MFTGTAIFNAVARRSTESAPFLGNTPGARPGRNFPGCKCSYYRLRGLQDQIVLLSACLKAASDYASSIMRSGCNGGQ